MWAAILHKLHRFLNLKCLTIVKLLEKYHTDIKFTVHLQHSILCYYVLP